MKKILFILFLVSSLSTFSQIYGGQFDDFEDGTRQNWFEAASSGAQAENVATDGPNGEDDSYLRDYTTQSPGGPGSRLIIRNTTQWIGNYISGSVQNIEMQVRALNVDITVRVSLTGAGGKFSSTTGVLVTAGSGWNQITIPIDISDMQSVSDGNDGGDPGTDINATLANVTELRILSSTTPSWIGEVTDAEMHLDNITATGVLSTDEFGALDNTFVISPNPGKNKLNIKFPLLNSDLKIEIYDVLGKRMYKGIITELNASISVSSWKSGVYLVKIFNDEISQTKRFVKQ